MDTGFEIQIVQRQTTPQNTTPSTGTGTSASRAEFVFTLPMTVSSQAPATTERSSQPPTTRR